MQNSPASAPHLQKSASFYHFATSRTAKSIVNHLRDTLLSYMATRFHWGLNGLNEPRFRAYSNLLSLRNGGQIDSPSETERFHNNENEGMDGDDDADTVVAQEITSFSNTKLKEVFQDRVAELVSNAKGGYHVAATLLIEWQEEAKLLVAKNETFKQRDRDFLELLQTRLRAIASTDRKNSLSVGFLCANTSRIGIRGRERETLGRDDELL